MCLEALPSWLGPMPLLLRLKPGPFPLWCSQEGLPLVLVGLPICTHGAVCCRCLLICHFTVFHTPSSLPGSASPFSSGVYLIQAVLLPLFLHLSLEAWCRQQAEPLVGWTFDISFPRDCGCNSWLSKVPIVVFCLPVLFLAGGWDGSHHCTLVSSGHKSM